LSSLFGSPLLLLWQQRLLLLSFVFFFFFASPSRDTILGAAMYRSPDA
jgi:hypothetical protein